MKCYVYQIHTSKPFLDTPQVWQNSLKTCFSFGVNGVLLCDLRWLLCREVALIQNQPLWPQNKTTYFCAIILFFFSFFLLYENKYIVQQALLWNIRFELQNNNFLWQVPVPREIVGFVIGKNGETIKRIQAETRAKVQFNMSMLFYAFFVIWIELNSRSFEKTSIGIFDEFISTKE